MIEVKDLHKSFGKLHVLKGINFTAEQGEVVVIIGPSGMGKSTFLRCLNCIEFPEQGSIEIDGVILNPTLSFEEVVVLEIVLSILVFACEFELTSISRLLSIKLLFSF